MAGELDAAIGDIVQVKEISNVDTVWAENKRTGSSGKLAWKAVHNIGPREMCDCLNQRCDCMYDDFSASQVCGYSFNLSSNLPYSLHLFFQWY